MWKVLVIEDDPMLAEIHKRYIDSHYAFECIGVAHDVEEARRILAKQNPDLIFLDVYLPKTSGIEFLVELREQGESVDVILITAARDMDKVEKAFLHGAIDYLIKPFEFSRLKTSLDLFLKRKAISESGVPVSQTHVDTAFLMRSIETETVLPKGLHERTLLRVKRFIDDSSGALTIDDIATEIEMSKVTLRRYLEYLEKIGEIEIEMSYGSRGRPSYLYKKKTMSSI